MALDVDGAAILGVIVRAPELFPDIRGDLAKTGRMLVVKQLKAKGLMLDGLRRVREGLGSETFALVLDGLTDAETKSLVTRLDRHHPDLKTAAPDWPRRHLAALGAGAQPVAKAAAATPKGKGAEAERPSVKAPKVTRALGSAAFAARWDGKDHDAKASKSKAQGKGGATKHGKAKK
ncbi:hypothetical protein [Methylobacterium sp. J-068]|uniref:hypothetical protein n=1 Tax=Methylobacterium sp. J-068 TaxID=2836649 RepID=UPI001FBB289F|nr:hypothetical protein [Methylobacterium sp. J-068]MCJ2033469.1 hypothetical protein [Methylobacterium sp. J-068]